MRRKLLHGFVLVLPIGVFYGPSLFGTDRGFLVLFTLSILLISIFVEWLRFRNLAFGKWFLSTFGSMLRREERSKLTGASYIAAASFFCAWLSALSEGFAACACLALSLFILGDAVAALAGQSIGRIRIGSKTLEGAVACFLLCLLLAYLVFPLLPDFSMKWGGPITIVQAIMIAGIVSTLELCPLKIGKTSLNDNLYVPVIVAFFANFIR